MLPKFPFAIKYDLFRMTILYGPSVDQAFCKSLHLLYRITIVAVIIMNREFSRYCMFSFKVVINK